MDLIVWSITNNSISHLLHIQSINQRVLFLTIQFSMSFVCIQFKMSNSSIWSIDRTLTVATTLGQSGPESDGNDGVLGIPQSSRPRALPSYCLGSYPGHLFGRVLPLSRDGIVFYSPSRLYKIYHGFIHSFKKRDIDRDVLFFISLRFGFCSFQ